MATGELSEIGMAPVTCKRAGCTFEEDSDPSLCDFTQGEEDDFDWLLFRTYSSPYASPDLLRGTVCDAQLDAPYSSAKHSHKQLQDLHIA
ncbi:hypothetical protein KUCAC02_014797 [Chaenocephalus aceratus]|uniref:Uncharacterized protein n=1 Tax=Chaenocephalus aceratus TaxID=36190 RepID=A0ACB9WGH0_CHAAC|nr:hypothetical protein KUCAC02_014797 [Chaenocephalus aceratus]